jgi:hypothetical protein
VLAEAFEFKHPTETVSAWSDLKLREFQSVKKMLECISDLQIEVIYAFLQRIHSIGGNWDGSHGSFMSVNLTLVKKLKGTLLDFTFSSTYKDYFFP